MTGKGAADGAAYLTGRRMFFARQMCKLPP